MDELMKQEEDHLAKGRVQIATDEAVHNIKHDIEVEDQKWIASSNGSTTHINRADKPDLVDAIASIYGSQDKQKEIILITYAPELLKHLRAAVANPEECAYWLFHADRIINELSEQGL